MIRRRFMPAFLILALATWGCGNGNQSRQTETSSPDAPAAAAGIDFKIGIMTGTVSQGEDEFRAAQMIERKYPGTVTHVTYPDNFMNEQETTIAQLVGLSADPEVKVIVASQAVPGSIAALRKIREMRPDIKVAFVEPHDDPGIVNAEADIAIQPDQLARGRTIIQQAKKMGAKHFVHYSFPRHMSQELLGRRRDIMKAACEENGMEFHFVTAPDPMAEGGLPATQQFVLEDVPREVGKLGPETAFFSTNCGMMDPIIRAILKSDGYFPEQCCPSPTHGYPTALGISIPEDRAGDFAFIGEQNGAKIAEHGKTGHFATWPVPEVILATRTMADLLADAVQGKADYKDQATVERYLEEEVKELVHADIPVTLQKYDAATGNSYLVLIDSITY